MTHCTKLPLYLLFLFILSACGSDTVDTREIRTLLNKGDHVSAETMATDAIKDKTDPANKELLLLRGVARYEQEKYHEALSDFNNYIKLDNTNYKAYMNRGLANAALEQWREAIEDYSAAKALAPEVADIYLNRSQAYYEIQRYGESLADANKTLTLDPKNKTALYNRGFLHYNMAKWEKAEEDFSQMLKISRNDPQALYGLGLTSVAKGDTEKGCKQLRRSKEHGNKLAKEAIAKYCASQGK